MEVMNDIADEQQNILVGSSGKTQNFEVSDDPMLMSMLSTGFYKNPLRTMIQEVMFNAWDAHRMGNCQDRPIDVYLNEDSGIIIRDYGPGIDPKDIGSIFCVYGNSTKRNDDGQTGGFGLGSKSPFAYNDSFMVMNQNAGKKFMYVVNRSCDENGGGPGMTPIIQGVPTEESGLTVTVPLKSSRDKDRAYDYLLDILFLSGIKINIHRDDKEPEYLESASMAPGEYINSKKSTKDYGTGLFAVYGGVRYEIPNEDAFSEEYNFLKKLSKTLGEFYIGFAPSTLTPLPSREGLNMSDKSIETIKSQLETMQEAFMNICKPACRAAMDATFSALKETGIQPQFLAFRWKEAGQHTSFQQMCNNGPTIIAAAQSAQPEGVRGNLWNSMIMMAYIHTNKMAELIGMNTFNNMRGIVFVKGFPEWKKHLGFLTDGSSHRSRYNGNIAKHEFPLFVREMNTTLAQLSQLTGQDLHLRMNTGNNSIWHKVSSVRNGGKANSRNLSHPKEEVMKAQQRLGRLKLPDRKPPSMDRLWQSGSGEEIKVQMIRGVVIIAKTATALNESEFYIQKYFAPGYFKAQKQSGEPVGMNSYHAYHSSKFRWSDSITPVPAIVIHKKKGGYDQAKEALKSMGYKVIEAEEPITKMKKVSYDEAIFIGPPAPHVPVKRAKPKFPTVSYMKHDWAGEEIENPQAYFCCTLSTLNGYFSYSKPRKVLLMHVQQRWPRTVILHSKARESMLIRRNIPLMADVIDDGVDKILADPERFRKMYLHSFVINESSLPASIIAIPEMQKLFGIPYLRTKQKEQFERDWDFIQTVQSEQSCHVLARTARKIKEALALHEQDTSVSLVRKMCEKSAMLDSTGLRQAAGQMKPGELKMFAQKIARFLRTV